MWPSPRSLAPVNRGCWEPSLAAESWSRMARGRFTSRARWSRRSTTLASSARSRPSAARSPTPRRCCSRGSRATRASTTRSTSKRASWRAHWRARRHGWPSTPTRPSSPRRSPRPRPRASAARSSFCRPTVPPPHSATCRRSRRRWPRQASTTRSCAPAGSSTPMPAPASSSMTCEALPSDARAHGRHSHGLPARPCADGLARARA